MEQPAAERTVDTEAWDLASRTLERLRAQAVERIAAAETVKVGLRARLKSSAQRCLRRRSYATDAAPSRG